MNNKIIGMIVPTMDNSFFSSLAVQVEKFMAAKGYQTILASCGNDADKEKEYLRKMAFLGMDGLICVSGLSEFPEGLIPEDMPLVWVDRVPDSIRKIPWVANDDARAMEMAVDHLIERGCRNILLLPGFLAERQESPRVKGYKAALEKHGIEQYPFKTNGELTLICNERKSEDEKPEIIFNSNIPLELEIIWGSENNKQSITIKS
jgi:DNA-binding LacI/PurR family transcriptional regulator